MSNSIALQKVSTDFPVSSLESYITRVNHVPMLTLEEEQALATQVQQENSIQAAKQLLLPHLRFVVKVARGYTGYGLALGDLIQEGNIGLMKAIKRFDPKVGVRLVSFAVHWVKAEIHEFILRNWRIVKIATTKAQRKLFFNLRRATAHLTTLNEEQMESVAMDLDVTTKDVAVMYERLRASDQPFDVSDSDDVTQLVPEQYLEDNRYNPAQQLEMEDWSENREHRLQKAMASLDERTQDILKRRWLVQDKSTLHDLASDYDISAERVRQIEKVALKKLKHLLSD